MTNQASRGLRLHGRSGLRARAVSLFTVAAVALGVAGAGFGAGAAAAEVSLPVPTISLDATEAQILPATIAARATLVSNNPEPAKITGTLYLHVYAPSATNCNANPLRSIHKTISGSVTLIELRVPLQQSDPAGLYRWQATYSGDLFNAATKSRCGSTTVLGSVASEPQDRGVIETRVTSVYELLLSRKPSNDELITWSARLINRTHSLGDLAAAIRVSDDHIRFVDPVVRLYSAYFLRIPDSNGLKYWIAQSRGGRSLVSISEFFSRSPEFVARYGTLSNAAFVQLIYTNILDRQPDKAGAEFWTRQLDKNARDRGDVLVGFSESPEYVKQQSPAVHVAVLYLLLLDRSPSAEDFRTLVDLLIVGPTAPLPFTVSDLADDLLDIRFL